MGLGGVARFDGSLRGKSLLKAFGALSIVALIGVLGAMMAQAADSEFTIFDGDAAAPILIDPAYGGAHGDRDYRQVRRAVQDLRQDVGMVSGAIDAADVQSLFVDDAAAKQARLAAADPDKVPALLTEADGEPTAIIVGVVGQSDLVDQIIGAGKFDEAADIAGKWEAFAIKEIDEPLPGVDNALVIAGSDARGTIYGIYSVSEEIGVSPWYWYSDVPVEQRESIAVDSSTLVDDGPDVKYRGIFINDEERTIEWAKLKFPTDKGTPEVNYYRHVYEMMLRLRLNTLWPAMHEFTTAFNAATDTGMYDAGTPINAEEAAEYGVIMSASHAELMLRNNVDEWRPFYERNKEALNIEGSNYQSAYNYSINKPAILEYWRERLEANRDFESILALGLRGVHDGAPAFTPGNPYGFANVVEMVGDAVTEQRNLIEEVYGSVDAVPQVFIPYKEMADLYNNGLKAYIPDDVTLMWAEDNAGYLRQVPTQSEAARSGGNGIYYHASYWGSPKSYLWLNSVPMALMVEQLHRAWDSNAGRYWILNVGDIKPGEMKTELFAKLAWDIDGYDNANIATRFLPEQLERDFGLTGDAADSVVDALERFSRLERTKRAEYWGTQNPSGVHSAGFNGNYSFPFSSTSDGDELQRYINEANELVAIVEDAWEDMDETLRPAFFQQVVHRVRSYRNQAEQIGYYWKNQLAAQQGRYGSAKAYALLSKAARERIRADEEHWDSVSDAKWDEAIGYSHPITYYGGVNEGIVMLTDNRYASVPAPVDGIGANAEGAKVPGSGTLRFNSAAPDDERFFDVFAMGDAQEEWIAEADVPWIDLSQTSGATFTEQRVTVSVDWSELDSSASGAIRVYDATDGVKTGEPVATFTVEAEKSEVELGETAGHIEANGYVAIEAEHFAENVAGDDGSEWRVVKRNAQRGDTMKSFPATAPRVDTDFASTAHLKYRVYFTSTGQFTGTFYRVPTLNEGTEDGGAARSARTVIGLDDNVPASANLRGCSGTGCGGAWANNVMRQIEPLTFTINVPTPGWHDLVVYRSDAAIVFDRIVIQTTAGAVGDGLVGPVESPNAIADGDGVQTAKVGSLPTGVTSYQPLPGVSLSVGEDHVVEGIDGAASVVSDNETAVSAALEGGEVVLTGNRVGFGEITVTTHEGAVSSFTATVTRAEGPPLGAYLEEGERVVIDAADALEKSAYANAIDSNNGTHEWALTRNGLQAVPIATGSSKAHWLATSASQGQTLLGAGPAQTVNGSAAPGTPPRLEFNVEIENGGTYYLFVNSSNPNADADSYHVAVDGQWRYHSSKGGEELGVETWYGSTSVSAAALALSPGSHSISVWAREAGFHVNQIVLTTDDAPELQGFLSPSQRALLGDNTPPVIDSLTADPASGEVPLDVDFAVEASDADGDELTYAWDFGDGEGADEQNPSHTYTEPGTYEAKVTVSDGEAEVSGAIDVSATAPPLACLSDEFDGTEIGSQWQRHTRNGGTPTEGPLAPTLADGKLHIPTHEQELDAGATGPVNFLGLDLPSLGEEWQVETQFTVEHTGGWQHVGLMVWQADNNLFRSTITHRNDTGDIYVEQSKDNPGSAEGNRETSNWPPLVVASEPQPITIKMRYTRAADANTVAAQYQVVAPEELADDDWVDFPSIPGGLALNTDPRRDSEGSLVGILSAGSHAAGTTSPSPGTVEVDYFRVSAPDADCPEPVNTPPVIDSLTADPASGEVPLDVDFAIEASDADGDELTYAWDFGDGEGSDEQNPSHTYTEPGAYEAEVTVSDGTDEVSDSVEIVVDGPRPCPTDEFDDGELDRARWSFRHPSTPVLGERAPRVEDGSLVLPLGSWSLDLDRAGPVAFLGQPLPEGDFTMTAKVSAPGLDSDTGSSGNLFYAQAGFKIFQTNGDWVKITQSRNADGNPPGVAPTYFEIATEDGGTRTLGDRVANGTGNLPTWWMRIARTGNEVTAAYTLTDPEQGGATWTPLTMSNGTVSSVNLETIFAPADGPVYIGPFGGSGSVDALYDYIRFDTEECPEPVNTPPVIDSLTADPASGEVPLDVDFAVEASDADGDELTYAWDFGDGEGADEQNPSHTYTEPGTYEAKVTVSDGTDEVADSVTVSVIPGDDSEYDPGQFRGANWADPRDNFTNDEVVPSGLSTADDYETTYAKAAAIARGFRSLGFNTLRLPVNPYSVGNEWWGSYAGAIDAVTDLGMNAFLSHWDGSGANNDGLVDDPDAWWEMWATIVEEYRDNERVFFNPMNEPYGYSPTEWSDLVADWLDEFADVPRERVIVSGHMYSEDLSVVCADPRLYGTYLALHNYAFWNTYSYEQWIQDHHRRLAGCSHRAIFEEFGVPMTTGLDFNAPPTGSTNTRNYIAFLQATTDVIREEGMGSVYWPGLRTGDIYRLTTLAGTGTDLSLEVTNQSGLDRLWWAWNEAPPVIDSLTADPASGEVPLDVDFAVEASDADGDELTYAWDFGDGEGADEQNPSHTYTEPGTYEAEVTVSDGIFEISDSLEVVVEEPAGPADTTPPVTTVLLTPAEPGPGGVYEEPVTLHFDAVDEDGGSGVAVTEFRVNGSPRWLTYHPTLPVTIGAPGDYTVEFRSTDNAGNVEDPPGRVEFSIAEPVDPPDPADVRAAVQPRKRVLPKRKKRTAFRVNLRNVGGTVSEPLSVCVKVPKRRLAIKGKRCVTVGSIEPGTRAKVRFVLKIKKRARGKTTRVRFNVRGGPKLPAVTVKVRR